MRLTNSGKKDKFNEEFEKLFLAIFGSLDEDELSDEDFNVRKQVCANIILKIKSDSVVSDRDFAIRAGDGKRKSFPYGRCVMFNNSLEDIQDDDPGSAIAIVRQSLLRKSKNKRFKEVANKLLDSSNLSADVELEDSAHVAGPSADGMPVQVSDQAACAAVDAVMAEQPEVNVSEVTLPFAVQPETLAQAEAILRDLKIGNQELQRRRPDTYYYDESNLTIAAALQQYVVCKLQALQFGRMSAKARQLSIPIQQLTGVLEVAAESNPLMCKDEEGYPMVLVRVNEHVIASDSQRKIELITQHFNLSGAVVNQYTGEQITAKFSQYERECSLLQSVNIKLQTLIERTKSQEGQQVSLVVTYSRQSLQFNISANGSLTMGYAIHSLLNSSKVFSRIIEPRENAPQYDGSTEFTLDLAGLEVLNALLKDLGTWYDDFELFMTPFIGNYIQVGQKPLFEVCLGEEKRERKLIKPDITQRLKQLPQDSTVFLFGMVSLNLTTHPYRDKAKHCCESMYRNAQLKDNKGDRKTFVTDTYLSLLSSNNISGIMEELMAYSHLAKIAQQMGMSIFAPAFEQFVCEGRGLVAVNLAVLRQHLKELRIIVPAGDDSVTKVRVQRIRDFVDRNFVPVSPLQTILESQQFFESTLAKLLNNFSGVSFSPSARSVATEITDTELKALLPASSRSLFPTTTAELTDLLQKLKESSAYIELKQELLASAGINIDTNISAFIKILEPRLDGARVDRYGPAYDGRPLTLQATEAIMTWVSRVYYSEKSQITKESISESFSQLQAIINERSDIVDGCGTGLVGRCRSILGALKTEADDPVHAAVLQLRRDASSDIFTQGMLRCSRENSMYATHLPEFLVSLGLEPEARSQAASQSTTALPDHVKKAFFQEIANKVTPAKIYGVVNETLLTNFKGFVSDELDEEIYNMLKKYCFIDNCLGELCEEDKSEIDRKYRFTEGDATSAWDISKFKTELPKAVIDTLIDRRFINPSERYANKISYMNGRHQEEFLIPRQEVAAAREVFAAREAGAGTAGSSLHGVFSRPADTGALQLRVVGASAAASGTANPAMM